MAPKVGDVVVGLGGTNKRTCWEAVEGPYPDGEYGWRYLGNEDGFLIVDAGQLRRFGGFRENKIRVLTPEEEAEFRLTGKVPPL